jgi:hypothetical protein
VGIVLVKSSNEGGIAAKLDVRAKQCEVVGMKERRRQL